ncbi:MAG TPA: sigma-70 family RNA polymerase sigma factor [Solirubrobacteraceae bacterium]|jgi:RNA polymerase sigma factor (sigma-70 family)|nr:sigma-70 family RNA polymerase sigma factor [Solirubrobacteraceae bacterium]
MEASALTHSSVVPALRGPTPLLRLQSDERLIALTRRGQHAAFEALCSRYQSRLLSFCRHMLGSREDAEDVLQEVFAAAFNAVLADEREINVRPWLYRIARNRSLNHLRRASAVGVDSMDIHFADHGMSTGDRAIRRESFRELLSDVHELPETQRTALLLREIDALSYEQIAHAMETTVPSVKSLLVRARISLAEAAEARKLSCAEVRLELGEVAEGLVKLGAPARRHVRGCERCRSFKKQLKDNNHALAAMLPVGPLLIFKKALLAKFGLAKLGSASAGSAQLAGGATVSAGAVAGAAGGTGAGGIFTVGAGALATKAVAGLAAAAIVGAGVAADQSSHHHRAAHKAVATTSVTRPEPLVVDERPQPVSAVAHHHSAAGDAARAAHRRALVKGAAAPKPSVPQTAAVTTPKPIPPAPSEPAVTQVTSESTQLPSGATAEVPTPIANPVTPTTTATATTPPPAATGTVSTGSPSVVPVVTTVATEATAPSTPPSGEATTGATTTAPPTPPTGEAPAPPSATPPAPIPPAVQAPLAQEASASPGSAAPAHRSGLLGHRWGMHTHLR